MKKRLLCTLLALVIWAPLSHATGWKPNVREGSDIVMKDHRWPRWDKGTYYCFWYMSFVPGHPRLGNLYGGIAVGGPEKPPGMFMSYWGEVKPVYVGEYFYPHGYGAEGASGGAHGEALFLRPNAWFRFVKRIFSPAEPGTDAAYVGWWVKDLEKNVWHTHSVVQLPARAAGFKGNSGFVEALGDPATHRAFERRLGYCRKDREWHKANTVGVSGKRFFKVIEDGTVLRYDRAQPDSAGDGKGEFTVTQPDAPTLDAPAIEGAEAAALGNQVSVRWAIPAPAAPQLGYKLELFGNGGTAGNPISTARDNAPFVLARRLDAPQAVKSVRITVTDIFDQQASASVRVTAPTLLPAVKARDLCPGLAYAYYEAPGKTDWTRLPDVAALKPVKQGVVGTLDDTVQGERYRNYAMRYHGFLKVPADGLYVFSMGTCDGSRLSLGGRVIADDDGLHGMATRQYPVALKGGLHAIELLYFKGPSRRHGGHAYLADKLSVSWEGPGFGPRKLTSADFMRRNAAIPSLNLTLKGTLIDGVLDDNLVEIVPDIDLLGRRLTRVQLYSGRKVIKSASGDNPTFKLLLPAGKNRVHARLWYDESCSVDSGNALEFETRDRTEGPWTFTRLGHKFPIAVRYEDGAASFSGEGFYVGTRKVTGDFTMTARIADITLRTRENGIHGGNWLGLYTSNVGRQREGQGIESTFNQWGYGLYRTAGGGMRGSADFPDLGGGRMSREAFPNPDHPWLRIVRRGSRFMSFTSEDGNAWHKVEERLSKNFTPEQYVGVCFRAVPGKGRGVFQGTIANMALARGEAPEEVRGKPRAADLRLENRITAVVQAPGDSNILYARSPTRGLLVSRDRGATWKPANGNLKAAEALAVRSVAVHPTDAKIVLRAGGIRDGGALKSGLWRSADAGETWKLVTDEIDADGRGPTTPFGEIISFSTEDPNLVAAGGETAGVFLSKDAGLTWASAGLAGERITCLQFVPKTSTLIVGTCADSEFRTMGLGEPWKPGAAPGRIYRGDYRNGKLQLRKAAEAEQFGVLNIGAGSHPNFSSFATTRGLYYTWQRDIAFVQRRYHIPADVFCTALGARLFRKPYGNRKADIRTYVDTYAAPFSADTPGVYLCRDRTHHRWAALPSQSDEKLDAGISCIAPDRDDPDVLFVCNTGGIHRSTDGGKTFRLVCSSPAE